ncbi:MAG: MBL fold metallo-hydrolase [Puniceicoccales bacterium]|nr:MBL fold metallo-hydrolase [Puniceicoccales bacterium]
MIASCHFLGSSSQGNCLLVKSTTGNFLIDVGLTGRQIVKCLPAFGITIQDIGAIFVTHEHLDHSQGFRGLAKYTHFQCFANQATAAAIDNKFGKSFSWNHFITGEIVHYQGFEIETFSIPHDAIEPVGYIFRSCDGGKSLCWMTDLGYVPQNIRERIKKSDILVLEANYDNIMLENDEKRPPAIKNRIRGRYGHLSNESAFDLVANAADAEWQKIFLAHLSRDCNDSRLLEALFGKDIFQKFDITVVDPHDAIGISYSCL